MTSSKEGRFIHQYIDGKNSIYYRKGPSNNLKVLYKFNSVAEFTVLGPENSFLSRNLYIDTWVMISITISGRFIKIYQNLSLMMTLDYISNYTTNYRMVIGSCSTGDMATDGFVYYFVVLDSDSVHNSFLGESSSNCLTGLNTCTTCNPSVKLEYSKELGCISQSNSTLKDSTGKPCKQSYQCRDGLTLNCLCPSLSCYYNSSNLVQCIHVSSGKLTQTASSCSAIGQGCCKTQCLECLNESSCLSCIDLNAFVDSDGLCSCKKGFYGARPLNTENSCLTCSSECLTCTNSSICETCKALNAIPQTTGYRCRLGYYQADDITAITACLKCYDDCLSCENNFCCSNCASDHCIIINSNCVCEDGYWKDSSYLPYICVKCKSDCLTCENSRRCTACLAENSLESENGCICMSGFIMKVN
jgi:hypothetical protein